ncbi:hypothetical protein BN1708_016940, partial [Verticillium longisporum]
MAAEGGGQGQADLIPGAAFKSSDFGLDQMDLEDMAYDDDTEDEEDAEQEDQLDPIAAERQRRAKRRDRLRRSAGEPTKPHVTEVLKLKENFLVMLRETLAE